MDCSSQTNKFSLGKPSNAIRYLLSNLWEYGIRLTPLRSVSG